MLTCFHGNTLQCESFNYDTKKCSIEKNVAGVIPVVSFKKRSGNVVG